MPALVEAKLRPDVSAITACSGAGYTWQMQVHLPALVEAKLRPDVSAIAAESGAGYSRLLSALGGEARIRAISNGFGGWEDEKRHSPQHNYYITSAAKRKDFSFIINVIFPKKISGAVRAAFISRKEAGKNAG